MSPACSATAPHHSQVRACEPSPAPQLDMYYNGFCNSVLWQLFHYVPLNIDSWQKMSEHRAMQMQWQAYQVRSRGRGDARVRWRGLGCCGAVAATTILRLCAPGGGTPVGSPKGRGLPRGGNPKRREGSPLEPISQNQTRGWRKAWLFQPGQARRCAVHPAAVSQVHHPSCTLS